MSTAAELLDAMEEAWQALNGAGAGHQPKYIMVGTRRMVARWRGKRMVYRVLATSRAWWSWVDGR